MTEGLWTGVGIVVAGVTGLVVGFMLGRFSARWEVRVEADTLLREQYERDKRRGIEL